MLKALENRENESGSLKSGNINRVKNLVLQNASYRYLEQSFRDWLDVQGYSQSTVYNLPNHIREFLHYLEQQGCTQIRELKHEHIRSYYKYLQERANQRRGGGLSNGHLNKHIQALRKFTEYLRKVGRLDIPLVQLHNEATSHRLVYLTESEIQDLFKATYQEIDREKQLSEKVQEALCARDRAMLAIFYGCGLRRTEGVSLDVGDINFDRSVLHVRKGKNHKERLVPISRHSLFYLQEWVYDHRPHLTGGSNKQDALFLSYRGKRMQGQSLFIRLKKLQYDTGNIDLIEKEIGLHTLRHSIATHFLAAGMPLENISQFLGHSTLESTQVYTHLVPTAKGQWQQPFDNVSGYNPIKYHEDEREF